MKNTIFNVLYVICIIIYTIGELHNPWLMLVFFAGMVVKYRVTKDVIDPISKDDSPHSWQYEHARQWALGKHRPLNPLKCLDCKNN